MGCHIETGLGRCKAACKCEQGVHVQVAVLIKFGMWLVQTLVESLDKENTAGTCTAACFVLEIQSISDHMQQMLCICLFK